MLKTTRVTLGNPVDDQIELTDADTDETIDPQSITLRYRRTSSGAGETVIQVPDPMDPPDPVERLEKGRYRALLELPTVGRWRIRWETENPSSASEADVIVDSIYPQEAAP